MGARLESFHRSLDAPVAPRARCLLALLVIPLLCAFAVPLWEIQMRAPQYPGGLALHIWAWKLEAGHEGEDVQEINTLNHYIGMRHIDEAALVDLDWIPFALAGLALLCLRAATIGNGRSLVDLSVVTVYVFAFAFGRFADRLWVFGHTLSPEAPVKVKPFMPVLLGTKQVANFTTMSFPELGSGLLGVFAIGVFTLTVLHLRAARREQTGVRLGVEASRPA